MKIYKAGIIKIICFIVLIVSVDQLAGKWFKHLYFNQKTGQGQQLNYVFSKCKEDVLIFGSSRAQHHYDTKIIGDSLKMSCYNAGIDGGHSILMAYAQIQVVLKRYLPKMIIIEFSPSFVMEYRTSEYERFSVLLPYYSKYPELRPIIEKRSQYEKLKLLSGIYPYNSSLIALIRFNTNIDADRIWTFDGYIPIKDKQMNETMVNQPVEHASKSSADPDKVRALEDIIQLCKTNNISLYLINSPIYETPREKQVDTAGSTKQIIAILNKTKTHFIDYSRHPAFAGNMNLFADKLHLNEKGATLFSQIIGSVLRDSILSK